MAQWISQSNVPSITPSTRRRTAYLTSLGPDVRSAIGAYFDAHPDGKEVTLAVLDALGRDRLEQVRGHRSFGRVKQDVGLLAAQTLVDLHGATRVETLRRQNQRSVSSRRCRWDSLDWVDSFTPHRILPSSPTAPRILLDTGIVRNVIHGDQGALDSSTLTGLKGAHPVSIADGALAELAAALFRGSVSLADWRARIGAFDDLLDPDFPVAPGGKEVASFWGGHSPVGLDLAEARAYYRAAWAYLRNATSAADMSRREIFYAPSGRGYSIQLDQQHVEAVLAEAGQKWSAWVSNMAALIKGLRDGGEDVTEAGLRQLTKSGLTINMSEADAGKLDLVIHVLAKRAIQAVTGRTPYNPKGKPNDALDLDLLFAIPLPAWVCTTDGPLYHLVQATQSADKSAVMTLDELIERLKAETQDSDPA